MWKEHLKSSSSRQELVPNSQSILTRCTFEEFENSTTRWRRSKLAWRRSSNQTADIPTFIPTACWLHRHWGSRSDASASFCRKKDAQQAHGPYPRADTDPNWREDVFKRHDCHTYIFAECAFGADVTARIIWRPRRRTNSYSRTRPTNPDPKWLVRGPIHDPCEKLVQTPLLKSPRIIRVVQSDWLID